MATREMLGQLPEQELAKITRSRIEKFATKSGFLFVADPIGEPHGSNILSHRSLSLFHSPDSNIVASASKAQPVGSRMQSGLLTFTNVIQDFESNASFIATGPSEAFYFFIVGRHITYFRPPTQIYSDKAIMYPEPSSTELVLAATDDPEEDVAAISGVDQEGSVMLVPIPPSAQRDNIWAEAVSQTDSIILNAFNNRTPKEVEESRTRLLELNQRLDKIDMERYLIPPPSRA